MLVTVDKNDFVVSAVNEMRRSETVPEVLQRCTGPWHSHNGTYDELPLSQFSISPKTTKHYKTCDKCRLGQNAAARKRHAERNGFVPDPDSVEPNTLYKPNLDLNSPSFNGGMHKWKVTIIRKTEVTVYAKDYLDAGVEAGEGEVTNVERMD